MLDKQKVMQELLKTVPGFFKETANELSSARQIFTWLQNNPSVHDKLQALESPIIIPSWQGRFDIVTTITPHEYPYAVIAVDGSQIYPDRHQGMSCYLLNSGVAHFLYNERSAVRLFSSPVLYMHDQEMSEDIVNCRRAELEFEVGLAQSLKAREDNRSVPTLFLCDGSLIFWHLESKHPRIKEQFLKRYIEQMDAFYQEKVLIAGCISLPKSRELVNVIRKCKAHGLIGTAELQPYDALTDTDIVQFYLKEHEATGMFVHNSRLAESYPAHLRPCFIYMHSGDEILRVEMPFWVAQDEQMRITVLAIVKDQCIKGNGYPIALAEAHEQAVVNGSDRQFFFEMLHKIAVDQNYRVRASAKSLKKRFVSV